MADIPITALTTAGQLSSSDLLYVAIPNPLSPIGFSLCKMTSAQFGIFLNKDLLFASDLTTDSKNIIGAINELKAGGGGGGASVIQLTAAEYAELTPAEKMNGSIYKLTDKAIFYCLDEEYHAVKELSTAQYNALTTAEQNNGTIYIQTDAETTGSDIPISTGETETIAEAISAITSINSFERPNSNYGKFFFYEVNGIKIGVFQDPKSLVANKYTILDFTLPEKFRPKYREVYLTLFEPSAAYTVRCKIQTNGVVSIYNYGTRDNTINTSGIIPYV